MAHQPAIIIVDIKQKKDTVIDVAIPSDSNIRQKEHLKDIVIVGMSFAQQLTKLLVVKFTVYFFPKL